MPDFLESFLAWYTAPLQRIGRKEFGMAFLVASVPGLILMFFGFSSMVGSFMEPVAKAMDLYHQSNWQGMQDMATGLINPKGPTTAPFDWGGFLNGLCLLALAPLSRMRLRDMGWWGWQEVALTVLFNISLVEGLIQLVTGYDLLPWGSLWGTLNFIGYFWLSMGKPKVTTTVFERMQVDQASADLQDKIRREREMTEQGIRKKDDDYDY